MTNKLESRIAAILGNSHAGSADLIELVKEAETGGDRSVQATTCQLGIDDGCMRSLCIGGGHQIDDLVALGGGGLVGDGGRAAAGQAQCSAHGRAAREMVR